MLDEIVAQLTFFFFAGISQQEYRAAVRAGAEIVWFCPLCPVAESSRISMTESSADILESEEFNPPLRDSFADQSTIYGPQAQPAIEESSEDSLLPLNTDTSLIRTPPLRTVSNVSTKFLHIFFKQNLYNMDSI